MLLELICILKILVYETDLFSDVDKSLKYERIRLSDLCRRRVKRINEIVQDGLQQRHINITTTLYVIIIYDYNMFVDYYVRNKNYIKKRAV